MPQRSYEKAPHLGQKKVEHLDYFLLLSQNTKSFALHIFVRNSNFFAPLILCFPLHVFFVHLTSLSNISSLLFIPTNCHNPSFGLTTKARACEGVGQEGSPGVTFHALGSVRECEGMNPHTPKRAPTLGIGIMVDFQIFRKQS